MTTPINDGSPVYVVPLEQIEGSQGAWCGMSLRDYFAAKALPEAIRLWSGRNSEAMARAAYEIADAMIKARKESK